MCVGRWMLLLLFGVALPAHACSCYGPISACSTFWSTPVVFYGTVLEKTLVRPPLIHQKRPDGSELTLISPGLVHVRISVKEGFRGADGRPEITVVTDEQNSACGYNFEAGKDYVVFAYPNKEGRPQVSHCGMTHMVQDAATDSDLLWMRGLPTSPPGATLYGGIGVGPGMSRDGVHILLDRTENGIAVPGTHRDLEPDNKGNFRIEGMPAGNYIASITTAPGTVADKPRTVTLIDKGCSNVSWNVWNDSSIRGRVVDAVGTPIAKMPMTLMTHDSRYGDGWGQVNFVLTDDAGRYSFDRVNPGDYIVAANQYGSTMHMPYPERYFPQAKNRTDAQSIHIGMAQKLEGMDVIMPMAMHTVLVPVVVTQADGSPATLAISVQGNVVATPNSAQPMMADVGEDGQAMLPLFEGEEYYITALDNSGQRQKCGGPLRLLAHAGMEIQAIRIEHPWGNCLAQLNPNFRPPR